MSQAADDFLAVLSASSDDELLQAYNARNRTLQDVLATYPDPEEHTGWVGQSIMSFMIDIRVFKDEIDKRKEQRQMAKEWKMASEARKGSGSRNNGEGR